MQKQKEMPLLQHPQDLIALNVFTFLRSRQFCLDIKLFQLFRIDC